MLSQLSICRDALSELPTQLISSLNESSQSADECRRTYPTVVQEFLEEFGFDFGIGREALAVVINDRPLEWGYAYALPTNLAFPIRILPDPSGVSDGSFVLLPGQVLAPIVDLGEPWRINYVIAGDTLYTNEPTAYLEYFRSDVGVSSFPALFARAVALEMAARMVLPILKSRDRQKELAQAAEIMKQRAMANNANRKPNTARLYASEDERARDGWY